MNLVLLHINRKYHIPIDNVLSVTKKRWGSIWVAYIDPTTKKRKIAIGKNTMSNYLTIVNNYRLMRSLKPILGIYEK